MSEHKPDETDIEITADDTNKCLVEITCKYGFDHKIPLDDDKFKYTCSCCERERNILETPLVCYCCNCYDNGDIQSSTRLREAFRVIDKLITGISFRIGYNKIKDITEVKRAILFMYALYNQTWDKKSLDLLLPNVIDENSEEYAIIFEQIYTNYANELRIKHGENII